MFDKENFSSENIQSKTKKALAYSLYVDANGVLSPISFTSDVDTKPYVHTIVISDVHLGSPVSRPRELVKLLEHYSFRQLILNGDIFDDLNLKRFRESDWYFLRYLRYLSNDRTIKVIWVIGNHDGNADLLSDLLGLRIYQEYKWTYDGKSYMAIHGHQFDHFLQKHVILSDIASWFYHLAQLLDGERQLLSRFIKRTSKAWLRLSHKVGDRALKYAYERGVEVVICGHTHQALYKSNDATVYYNSGCWTDTPSHYITIDTINGVTVNEF